MIRTLLLRRYIRPQSYRRLLYFIATLPFLTAYIVPASNVAAASNYLYVSPANIQMSVSTTFCIDVISYASSGVSNGSATGTLSFNSSLLTIESIYPNGKICPDSQGNDNASSYYSTSRDVTQNTSSIDFNATQNQTDGGVRYVFSVKFKTKASGTASISFTGNSKVNNADTSTTGGTYTINAPQPTSTPTPTPKTTKTPTKTSSPTPTPITTKPDTTKVTTPTNTVIVPETTIDETGLISSVAASPHYTKSKVTWQVNAPGTSSVFKYGTSYNELDMQSEVKKEANGNYSATMSNLLPGMYYYFSITTKGKNNLKGSYNSSFVTNGYPIRISVTENNIPVQSAQVRIGEQSLTVKDGSITIGLAAGDYNGTITTDTATLNISLSVENVPIPENGSQPETQQFGPYNLSSAPLAGGPGSSFSILSFLGVLAGGTVVLAFSFIMFVNYRKHKFESDSYSTGISASTVVVEDGYNWRQDTSPTNQVNTPEYPPTDITSSQTETTPTHHQTNSVHVTEDEPLDMFETSTITVKPNNSESSSPTGSQQNPNSLHSTKH